MAIATISHPDSASSRHWHLPGGKRRWLIAAAFVVLAGVMIGIWFLGQNWPFRYRKIHPLLEDVFGSQVFITRYHRTYFPHPGFIATGIVLRRKSAPDQPPIGTVQTLFVQGRWADLLLLRDRLGLVDATGVHIVLPPPGSRAAQEDFPAGSSNDFTGPETAIALLQIHDSVLDILRGDGSRFTFPVRMLRLENVLRGHPAKFAIDMDNAIPHGRIVAFGSFGPLNAHAVGETPVTGHFTFNHINLSEVGELHGTLNSSGNFGGKLDSIEAQAQVETPDFAISDGHATPITGSIDCIVNGLNGDVIYHSLEARTGATVVHASGSTAGTPRKPTHLEFAVKRGRVEDVMRPFMHRAIPISGPVSLHGRAYLEPSQRGRGFLDRLHVQGAFDVPAEQVNDPESRQKLSDFSRRARKKEGEPTQKGSPPNPAADAISSVQGPVTIEHGVASTPDLTFQVTGATAHLRGTFNFHTCEVHLTGTLATRAELSDITTGFKAFLLEPFDMFFRKHRHGAEIPIAVTGTPGHYQVTQNFNHKK
jgi:hypothetical protein